MNLLHSLGFVSGTIAALLAVQPMLDEGSFDDIPVIGCVNAVGDCFEDLALVLRDPTGFHDDPCGSVHDACSILEVGDAGGMIDDPLGQQPTP